MLTILALTVLGNKRLKLKSDKKQPLFSYFYHLIGFSVSQGVLFEKDCRFC
jgi:hypothetical protein